MFKKADRKRQITIRGCIILNIILIIIATLSTLLSITGTGLDNSYFIRVHFLISIYSLVTNIALLIVFVYERIHLKDTNSVKYYWSKPVPDYSSGVMILTIILSIISVIMSFLKLVF